MVLIMLMVDDCARGAFVDRNGTNDVGPGPCVAARLDGNYSLCVTYRASDTDGAPNSNGIGFGAGEPGGDADAKNIIGTNCGFEPGTGSG